MLFPAIFALIYASGARAEDCLRILGASEERLEAVGRLNGLGRGIDEARFADVVSLVADFEGGKATLEARGKELEFKGRLEKNEGQLTVIVTHVSQIALVGTLKPRARRELWNFIRALLLGVSRHVERDASVRAVRVVGELVVNPKLAVTLETLGLAPINKRRNSWAALLKWALVDSKGAMVAGGELPPPSMAEHAYIAAARASGLMDHEAKFFVARTTQGTLLVLE